MTMRLPKINMNLGKKPNKNFSKEIDPFLRNKVRETDFLLL